MRRYSSKEVVEAIRVNWMHGAAISDKKAKKGERMIDAEDQTIVGHTFAGQRTIRLGDYVIFRNGRASEVLGELQFKAAFKLLKEKEPEPAPTT